MHFTATLVTENSFFTVKRYATCWLISVHKMGPKGETVPIFRMESRSSRARRDEKQGTGGVGPIYG